MDQRRLEYFIAVAEELNFTRAAQRLHVTQSTLSAGVKALEAELKVELLSRSTRAVRLTEAGSVFLPEARTAVESLDRARAAVEPLATGLRGSLTVGVLSGLTVVDVPALAGDFHRRHPQVRLRTETSQRGTAGLLERIKESHVDVAFVGAEIQDEHLRARPIKRYHVQLLVPAGHPLAGREAVRLRNIAAQTFVDMPEGFGQRQLVDDAFAKAGLSRQVVIEVSDITTIADYVAHGLGVALLPPDLAERAGETVRAVPLADVRLTWTLSVVASATRPPTRALHAFLDLIPHHIRRDRVF
ncbi:LysR family transcriptional regulator [Streptomyces hygroscopicus subsp. hygroscopicus]|uniref:LysR family transcriptional regulator n=1 Tax=Streptomyces hygroscopicus TaxID=1912 RepID=UPI0007829EEF|nr:LysR family transcriptional regulator [Streptomyces hygroscopicus]MBW8090987.1 LysR family transcriptional regulator [Streptomyces hygroscopicus subsp. hygroscopicus]